MIEKYATNGVTGVSNTSVVTESPFGNLGTSGGMEIRTTTNVTTEEANNGLSKHTPSPPHRLLR